ncbi:MAG: AMP-binding protein, partial [Verrucomicrobiota bacterium]
MPETFVEAFQKSVLRNGSLAAVETSAGLALSYAQLDFLANEKAASFESGIIEICEPRSVEFLVSLLAVWKAGKTALILDPEWPTSRLDRIRQHAGDDLSKEESDAAYLIYTSGTTGLPKGVLVSHRGLVSMLKTQIEAFRLLPQKRVYWMNGVAFDASISDIGTALLSGATIVIDAEMDHTRLIERWKTHQVTHVDVPPAMLPLLDPEAIPPCLESVAIGGMVAKPESVRRWAEKVHLVNVYGPTEATICTSYSICDSQWDSPLIGRPIPGIVYRIDPINSELIIEGDGVALGYHRDASLTAERFDGRRYRTGDRVRKLDDGQYVFLGRIDRQVKVHGKLVCPEEIERALLSHPSVDHCEVSLGQGRHLVADVVSRVDQLILKRFVEDQLPHWMVPSEWRFQNQVKLGSSGKPEGLTKTESLLQS